VNPGFVRRAGILQRIGPDKTGKWVVLERLEK
jgi:hypothetical protein